MVGGFLGRVGWFAQCCVVIGVVTMIENYVFTSHPVKCQLTAKHLLVPIFPKIWIVQGSSGL